MIKESGFYAASLYQWIRFRNQDSGFIYFQQHFVYDIHITGCHHIMKYSIINNSTFVYGIVEVNGRSCNDVTHHKPIISLEDLCLDGGLVLAPGHYFSWLYMLTVMKLVWLLVLMLSSCLSECYLSCALLYQITSKQGFSYICWNGCRISGIIHFLH